MSSKPLLQVAAPPSINLSHNIRFKSCDMLQVRMLPNNGARADRKLDVDLCTYFIKTRKMLHGMIRVRPYDASFLNFDGTSALLEFIRVSVRCRIDLQVSAARQMIAAI